MIDSAIQDIDLTFRALESEWDTARAAWKDDMALQFEREVIDPLASMRQGLLGSLEELGEAMRRAADAEQQ